MDKGPSCSSVDQGDDDRLGNLDCVQDILTHVENSGSEHLTPASKTKMRDLCKRS